MSGITTTFNLLVSLVALIIFLAICIRFLKELRQLLQ